MRYEQKSFTVGGDSKAYRDNFDRAFGKTLCRRRFGGAAMFMCDRPVDHEGACEQSPSAPGECEVRRPQVGSVVIFMGAPAVVVATLPDLHVDLWMLTPFHGSAQCCGECCGVPFNDVWRIGYWSWPKDERAK